jgi:hypothetical protein
MAAGDYVNTSSIQYPLLAINTSATTASSPWSYIVSSSMTTLPSDFGATGIFNSASCNSTICIAGGSYVNDAVTPIQAPLLALITSGSLTNYPIDSTSPSTPLTNFASNGSINSTVCTDNVCLAAGNYTATVASGGKTYPMVALSNNSPSFSTWSYVLDATFFDANLPNLLTGEFDSVSCNNTLCYASGYYTKMISGINSTLPLLVVSTQSGVTGSWSIEVSTPSDLPTDTISDGNLGEFLNSLSEKSPPFLGVD